MRALEELDRWIAGKIKNWSSRVSGEPQGRELLEIRRTILEGVRAEIEPSGAGRSVFPFNRVSIQVAAADEHERAVMEATLAGPHGIEVDLRELLAEARCPEPKGFHVEVAVIDGANEALADGLDLRFSNLAVAQELPEAPPPEASPVARPNARLRVLRGSAEPAELEIHSDRVHIGRLKEVAGMKDGLRRRNDVAFAETETTVSREHATIRYDSRSGHFRLFDSGSQRGASIFREGRRLAVPAGSLHGLQLKSGDEIHLGEARLLFESQPSASGDA